MKARIAAVLLLLAAPALALAQPQNISRPGTVAHAAARAGFPETVGSLRRINVVRYAESDISASYELDRGGDHVRISVYIYPAPPTPENQQARFCREHMDGVVDAVVRQHPGAEEVENGAAPPVPGVGDGLGLRAVQNIEFPLRNSTREPARSESRLYCFVGGDWLVKYRVSANPGFDVSDLVDEMLRSGPWPGRGPGSIAMR
jgi:hypothetical protein